jgi:hypothetical protein
MSKIVTTIAVLMFALAATASAAVTQDYRSPDARPATVTQDYRSPDARPATVTQDYRSPDARSSGRFVQGADPQPVHDAGSFDWGYLVAAIAGSLLIVCGLLLTQRRRRHGLAIGS